MGTAPHRKVCRRCRLCAIAVAAAALAACPVGAALPAGAQSPRSPPPSGETAPLSASAAARSAFQAAAQALDLQTAMPKAPTQARFVLPVDVVRILVWVAVLSGLILLALTLGDILPFAWPRRRARWAGEAGDAAAGDMPEGAAASQVAADALARAGHYGEAIHVLLLQALTELRRRQPTGLADSLTSREILRRAPLPAEARTALRQIIGHGELVHFGGYSAGPSEYAACRRDFDVVARALQGPATA